ncbi:MAG: SusC/RagA family TonB-linked outer membrane protein [Bacteroidota bacterium]
MHTFSKLQELKKIAFFSFLLWVVCYLPLFGQDTTLTVEGVVLTNPGQPAADVTVSIEGSLEMPVVTDEEGKFTLTASSGDVWLSISPTGNYKPKRVFLNGRTQVTIYLTPDDIKAGQDDINILSHAIDDRNLTASHFSLSTEEIHHTPALTVDQYMQGRVGGLNIINRSGLASSGTLIANHGLSSIHATTQPLYVVDGIPLLPHNVFSSNLSGFEYNPLLAVNPQDISRLTVVKDPSVTAGYGSKGSNGVIYIETLDPSVTSTVIEADLRTGYSLAPENKIPQLNAKQHKALMNEVLFSSNVAEEQVREMYPGLYLEPDEEGFIDYQHDTKWQDYIFDNSSFTNFNMNVKGGDEIARYGLSFGFMDNKGIIKNTGYTGYNLRFVSRVNVFPWLKMNAGVALNYSTSSLKEAGTVDETSPIITALAKSPLLNPFQYDLEDRELTTLAMVDEIGVSNPQAVIDNYTADNTNYNFISTLDFEAVISENISFHSDYSLSYNVLKEELFQPNLGMELYDDDEAWNVALASNNSITSFYNNSFLSISRQFGANHNLSSSTGVQVQTNQYEFDWGMTKNAPENDEYRNLQSGQSDLREVGGQNRIWNYITLYEFLHYAYQDKYLMTASVSLDGSSRVGEEAANTISVIGEPFGLFYGLSAGWRISSESFMKNMSWLEELKLRASFGTSGNDDIGESTATNFYNTTNYRQTVGLYPAVIPNEELTYETVTQINGGLDLSLWANRVALTVDYFISNTSDMLIFSPVDRFLGYDFRAENAGEMENVGWETNAFARIINGASFKWDIQASVSSVQNEITSIKGGELTTDILGAELINRPGEQANSFYGYVFEGVYSSTQEASDAGLVNDKGMPYQAGDARFADLSGPEGTPDGVIDNYDKKIIGSTLPDFFGGLGTAFSYKNLTLSGFVQFSLGNDVFNYIRYKNEQMSELYNQSATVLNRWQYEGHETDVPRALWDDPIGNSSFSTRWVEDGSYVRVKNITLSYKIPDEFLAFRNAEFYVSANNMFVFSEYLGYDPEFSYSYSNEHQGVDYGQTPQPRQFIAGIKLGL